MRAHRLALLVLAGIALTGCGQTMGSARPSLETLEVLRAPDMPKMRVGEFALEPGQPAKSDKSVVLRSVVLSAPDGSFSHYLGKTLEAQLRAAGKLDPESGIVVEGLLTKSGASAGLSDGQAALAARFMVRKDGRTVFDKELTVRSNWDSTFVGVVAIPDAINQYSSLYDRLVHQLFADPDFRRALAP
jgi:hypothetical protein